MRETGFNKIKHLMMSNSVKQQRATNLHINNSTFVSLIYTFSLGGNINVYTSIHGTNRKKYFNHIIYKGKNADSGGK